MYAFMHCSDPNCITNNIADTDTFADAIANANTFIDTDTFAHSLTDNETHCQNTAPCWLDGNP